MDTEAAMVSRIRQVNYDCVVCGVKLNKRRPKYVRGLFCAEHAPEWYTPSKIPLRVDPPAPTKSKQHG